MSEIIIVKTTTLKRKKSVGVPTKELGRWQVGHRPFIPTERIARLKEKRPRFVSQAEGWRVYRRYEWRFKALHTFWNNLRSA